LQECEVAVAIVEGVCNCYVSYAKETYKDRTLLRKRPTHLDSLLAIVSEIVVLVHIYRVAP